MRIHFTKQCCNNRNETEKRPHKRLFQSVNKLSILHTGVGWVYHYISYLKDEGHEWDLILAVSEQGRSFKTHLKEMPEVFKNKKVEVILASSDIEGLESNIKGVDGLETLSDTPLLLPWWQHSRHFNLFLKRTSNNTGNWKKDWRLKKVFYYKSPDLSRCVNPIYTKNEEDLEIILYIFAKYWFKAEKYTECIRNNSIPRLTPIIPNKREMNKIIQKILNKYDEKRK